MDWLHDPIEPMQAKLVDEVPKGNYLYEVKWDGVRAIIVIENDKALIHTRNQNDVTNQFPELQEIPFNLRNGVFDSEIVCLDKDGRPSFSNVIKRVRTTSEDKIQRLKNTHPAQCYVFDCLFLNGEPLTDDPLWSRNEKLSAVIKPNKSYRLSEIFEDGEALFNAIKEQKMEGIIAKKRDSTYTFGKRSNSWKKVKVRHYSDCKIIGYTKGEGDRSASFGALQLAEISDGQLMYRGKVGSGFTDKKLKETKLLLDMIDRTSKPDTAPFSKNTVWVKPLLTAKISYSEVNKNGTFRAPVFEEFIL